jgi:hypothetical protein
MLSSAIFKIQKEIQNSTGAKTAGEETGHKIAVHTSSKRDAKAVHVQYGEVMHPFVGNI